MPGQSIGPKALIRRVEDPDHNANFQELHRVYSELGLIANGRPTALLALVTGDNAIQPTVSKPIGRQTIYQDAAANLTDKGLNSSGQWVVTASAPCNAKFLFF